MRNPNVVIDVLPVESELLTAAEFIELVKKNPGVIKRSAIIPARLGSKSFGSFSVEYKNPIYKSSPSKL